jgi:hypothetical protein
MAQTFSLNDLVNSQGVLEPDNTTALLAQTKQNLVAQYPYLARNPEFEQDLSDSFSKFVNQGLQRGADYDQVFNQTVAPTVAKWQAKAGQDTARLTESQELAALDMAKRTGSPTAAVQAFPQLIAPTSKFRAEWVGRINKADESSASAKFQQTKDAAKLRVVSNTGLTPEQRDAALTQIDALKPSLAPPQNLAPSPGAGGAGGQAVPAPSPGGSPVASPMGTSGFVNPNPALRPTPQMFIGKPTAEQAAALLQSWNNRTGGQPSLTPPGTPSDMQPNTGTGPVMPANAAPQPATQPTLQNSGVLGLASNAVTGGIRNLAASTSSDPATLRKYVKDHPDLGAASKKALLDRADQYEAAPALTYANTIKPALTNIGTTGALLKDFLVGTSEAPLPIPPGRSKSSPVKPATKEAAANLPSGTWIQDPAGNIFQKQ